MGIYCLETDLTEFGYALVDIFGLAANTTYMGDSSVTQVDPSGDSWFPSVVGSGVNNPCLGRIGIIGACGTAVVSGFALCCFSFGNAMAGMGLSIVGSTFAILSALALLASCLGGHQQWRHPGAWALMVLIVPFLALTVGVAIENTRRSRRVERAREYLESVVTGIESLRTSTGEIPKNSTELVKLLDTTTMTTVSEIVFEYDKDPDDPSHYRVWCVTDGIVGDILEYDSRRASLGIVTRPF